MATREHFDPDQLAEELDQALAVLRERTSDRVAALGETAVSLTVQLYGAAITALARAFGQADLAALSELVHRDALVASLLIAHDCHPEDAVSRARRAIDLVAPRLGLDGRDLSLERIDPQGTAQVRLAPTTEGCRSSGPVIQSVLAAALAESVPEITAVDLVVSRPPVRVTLRPRSASVRSDLVGSQP
jgi:Fe-S cluster biogenesis protein NfuA